MTPDGRCCEEVCVRRTEQLIACFKISSAHDAGDKLPYLNLAIDFRE
jgi:hypothetical protein